VVGFGFRTPTIQPVSSAFQIGGYIVTATANGGAFGVIKVSTSTGNPVPSAAISTVTDAAANIGVYATGMVLDK